jgi:hypothetical protein
VWPARAGIVLVVLAIAGVVLVGAAVRGSFIASV